jgi:hypothetical protein
MGPHWAREQAVDGGQALHTVNQVLHNGLIDCLIFEVGMAALSVKNADNGRQVVFNAMVYFA